MGTLLAEKQIKRLERAKAVEDLRAAIPLLGDLLSKDRRWGAEQIK